MPEPLAPSAGASPAGGSSLRPASRGEIFAWAMYDWANSAYSTLSITILNGYLLHIVFPREQWERTGDVVYAMGIGGSMLAAGLLSPICGAWADARANKRGWLACTAWTGAAAVGALALVDVGRPWLIAALFVAASFCFELSLAFYNGFLPELADERSMNRVSAWGFGLGYVGGGLSLVAAMLLLALGPRIGLPTLADQLRAGLMLLALWWAVFSIPTIVVLRDRVAPKAEVGSIVDAAAHAVREVRTTLTHVRRLPTLAIFLVGFLFYNDAVQSVISQASTFATRELEFTSSELAQVILMIQFLAFPGALAIGRISDRWGAMRALHLCLIVWTGLLLVAPFIQTKPSFWVLSAIVALVMGGIQSVSRAVMGSLTPADRAGEFFGFFNLSGKATSFMGATLFSVIVQTTQSARPAIVSLGVLLVIGWIIVSRVNIERGRLEAGRSSRESPPTGE